jgi:hypothetical protein
MFEEGQHRWKPCGHCEDGIGIGEPVFVEQSRGRIRTAHLNLDRHERIGPWRVVPPLSAVAGGAPA